MPANRLIDLSSDTSTRPSAAMRKAMAAAEVGDEQKGEDPTTNALQARVADLLGKEAAVFLPSGTMCNHIALLVHGRPGDEVIAADIAHIFTSEAGGGSAFAGLQTWPLATARGIFTGAQVDAAVREAGRRAPRLWRLSRLSIAEAVRCGRSPPSRTWRTQPMGVVSPCTWMGRVSSMPWLQAVLPPTGWQRPVTASGSTYRKDSAARSAACS